jgi:hypothetical protein
LDKSGFLARLILAKNGYPGDTNNHTKFSKKIDNLKKPEKQKVIMSSPIHPRFWGSLIYAKNVFKI